jgi:hypothetical protein
VDKLVRRQGWAELPISALGASSGGFFVGVLPYFMRLAAINPQIMPIADELINEATVDTFPCVVFSHMPRDASTASHIAHQLLSLRARGVTALEQRAMPLQISATFFAERTGLTESASASLVDALNRGGFLNSEGFLRQDPRQSTWRRALLETAAHALGNDTLLADQSAINEELNVAWAQHEFISDFVNATLDVFDACWRAQRHRSGAAP